MYRYLITKPEEPKKSKVGSTLLKVILVLGSLAAIGTAAYLFLKKYKEDLCSCCDCCDDDYDDLFCDDDDCCCDDCEDTCDECCCCDACDDTCDAEVELELDSDDICDCGCCNDCGAVDGEDDADENDAKAE